MRFIITLAIVLASFAAQAQSNLLLSHVQHFYAGGGGCAERFWLEWANSDVEITDVKIQIELQAKGEESVAQTLSVARLGTAVSDRTSEVLLEMPRCLSGHPSIVIRKASATVLGQRINLLQSRQLQISQVERYPLVIRSPALPSSGQSKTTLLPPTQVKR